MSVESPNLSVELTRAADTLRAQVAATLASGIIAASGRPHSIKEALEIVQDIQFAMYPAPGIGRYKEWEKTKDERLSKVHS